MREISTQRHITQLLLIDTETNSQIRELVDNSKAFAKRLSEIFGCIHPRYTVILTMPESNIELINFVTDIKAEMISAKVDFVVNIIPESSMFLKGKIGLLLCSLWCTAGALIVNDVTIPITAVEQIAIFANRLSNNRIKLVLRKLGWFGVDYHMGILSSESSVGYLLKGSFPRLSEGHTVQEILQFMKSNCQKGELNITKL